MDGIGSAGIANKNLLSKQATEMLFLLHVINTLS